MAGKIVRGLAIAAGAGLGMSLSSSRKRQPGEVRDRLDKIEARLAALETGLQQFASEVPAMLETILTPRIEELRTRLHNETQERVDESLAEFERNIGDAVSARLAVLEKARLEQSAALTTLSRKAIDTDGNLQHLISAVEQLCAHAELTAAPSPAKEPTSPDRGFQAHLDDAIRRS
jgi:hypothetical protein